MSNAEQERIEKAWEEAEIPIDCVLGENKWAVMKNGFRYGFLAGRADAMELPEVRAEELVVGEIYRYRGISSWFPVRGLPRPCRFHPEALALRRSLRFDRVRVALLLIGPLRLPE